LTREWGLPWASTPVSASKTSFARFSQASSNTAASRNNNSWDWLTGSPWLRRQPDASSTGMTATAYIGHLMAAFQRRRRSGLGSVMKEMGNGWNRTI